MQVREGDLVHIRATDHTSYSTDGWAAADKILAEEPTYLEVCGAFVGEANGMVYIALAQCDGYYSEVFMLIKNAITDFRILTKKGEINGKRVTGFGTTARHSPGGQ